MNKALNIKNWKEGGNSYVLKGNPKNRWIGFLETVMTQLKNDFSTEFNLVIWTDNENEDDYYCIPFSKVNHLFIEENKTTGDYKNRWTAIIVDHEFRMKGNQNLSLNVAEFYSSPLYPTPSIEIDEDYYIENAKAQINIRLGQSKFRRGVLENFQNKCAVTGISETELLIASHIVPWAHKKEFRGDITNGLSLYIEIDMLFDKGYISVSDDMKIIATPRLQELSSLLKSRIKQIEGKKLSEPNQELNKEYLKHHRENILKK